MTKRYLVENKSIEERRTLTEKEYKVKKEKRKKKKEKKKKEKREKRKRKKYKVNCGFLYQVITCTEGSIISKGSQEEKVFCLE